MITKFEKLPNKRNFKKGDFVICINDLHFSDVLKTGEKYQIDSIEKLNDRILIKLVGIKLHNFSPRRFVHELDYYANKYNI
jgi:hypothetical protein